jgi:C-terminal processing protease CtpA/Prc
MHRSRLLLLSLMIPIALSACAGIRLPGARVPAQPTAVVLPSDQPTLIRGDLTYTGDQISGRGDHAVLLVDLAGFVQRDWAYVPAASSQSLAPLQFAEDDLRGSYELRLPAAPGARLVDVDHDGAQDVGVQIFNLVWWADETGGPFADGDDQIHGWAHEYASTIHDPNTDSEVVGGMLIVWAPDDRQRFPTDFGADGRLFTADDPIGPIPLGYSVVNLDRHPFVLGRATVEQVDLHEPAEYATRDLQSLSRLEAFNHMAEQVRASYAFNGVAGKEPDWDQLIAATSARIREADEVSSPDLAYYRALRQFTYAFHDGHVGISGGDLEDQAFEDEYGAGYGIGARELDDGRFLVTLVAKASPAEQAGIEVGAELLEVNAAPVAEAMALITPFGAPYSTRVELRYQQLRYLLRAPLGASAAFTFRNPGAGPETVTLEAIDEDESFDATSVLAHLDGWLLPVEFWYLEQDVGNILVGTNADDSALTLTLFERALEEFEAADSPGIVIDLRQNDGGQVLGLAGFFSDQPIELAQELQRDTKTGVFESRGALQTIEPKGQQFSFKKIAVLVGFGCASACEAEAYALSTLPNAVVVGQYPTSGMYASVIGDEYLLPDGISLQFSKWRYETPQGKLFLEGAGVAPTRRAPVDQTTVLADEDVVRRMALQEILGE